MIIKQLFATCLILFVSIECHAFSLNEFNIGNFEFGPNPFLPALHSNAAIPLAINYNATQRHSVIIYGYSIYGERLFTTTKSISELEAINPDLGEYEIPILIDESNQLQQLSSQLVILIAQFTFEGKTITKRGYLVVK